MLIVILSYFFLIILVISTSIIPLFLPFTIGHISYLLYIGISPYLLLLGVIVAVCIVGYIRYIGDKNLWGYIQNIFPRKYDMNKSSIFHRLEQLSNKPHAQNLLFGCVIIASFSSLPDIIIIRLVRSKMSLMRWICSYTVGKILLYVPIIFGVQGILAM